MRQEGDLSRLGRFGARPPGLRCLRGAGGHPPDLRDFRLSYAPLRIGFAYSYLPATPDSTLQKFRERPGPDTSN
jgi:hypothetical protein